MNAFEQALATLETYKEDANQFYNHNNNAAGTRLRKGYLEVKKLTDAGRKDVTEKREKRQADKTAA